jgi:hypothetical protein
MTVSRVILLAAVALGLAPAAVAACPFCASQGQTLSAEVGQADFIVLGTLKNPQRDPNDFTRGTTDLVIETIVKPHDYLRGKKVLTLPRYVPVEAGGAKFLVFAALYSRPVDSTAAAVVGAASLGNFDAQQLDPYRGEPVKADSKLAEYLKGAIEIRQKDPVERLRYFFEYLDAADLVISSDAMNEFGSADYKEVRALAEKLPADKVLKWLKDPNTPASRFGLYGLFVGHCGKSSDAKTVRDLLDQPDRQFSSGLDGMLAAYVLLDRKAGWEYLTAKLSNSKEEFPVRYAALKVLRFFWEMRPDVVSHPDVTEAMKALVAQPDLADLPIEDLRKWGCWELTPFVLKFADEPSHNAIPIVRRAILRFMIAAPASQKAAKDYVEKMRKQDPERVKFVEQTLQDEQPKPTTDAAQAQPATRPGGGND